MTIEQRHLIKEKADELITWYEEKAKQGKAEGKMELALTNTIAASAVSRFMLEILILDAEDKI